VEKETLACSFEQTASEQLLAFNNGLYFMGLISCDYTVCYVVWMYESYAEVLIHRNYEISV
jgi:hypothetical protein